MSTVQIDFNPQFAEDVEDGRKRQTIRRSKVCERGDTLQLTSGEKLISYAVCERVRRCVIGATEMSIDGKRLYAGSAPRNSYDEYDDDFASDDGFDGYTAMADWFHEHYGTLPFAGFLIEWRLIGG